MTGDGLIIPPIKMVMTWELFIVRLPILMVILNKERVNFILVWK